MYLTVDFFRQEDDTTVIADGFPILNALKEVHTILTEGQDIDVQLERLAARNAERQVHQPRIVTNG